MIRGLGLLLYLTWGADLQRTEPNRLIAAALVGISAAVLIALIVSPDLTCRVEHRADLRIETCTLSGGVSVTTLVWVSAAAFGIAWAVLGLDGGGRGADRRRVTPPERELSVTP